MPEDEMDDRIIRADVLKHLWQEELNERVIWLCDTIDTWQASAIAMALRHLTNYPFPDPIWLHIHTPGGFLDDAWSIVDSVLSCPQRVIATAQGHVCSAGTLVLAAADIRISLPHSQFMIHSSSGAIEGQRQEVNDYLERLQNYDRNMAEFMGERTRVDAEWWMERFDDYSDTWMSAAEALEIGLVDWIQQV
jgi:ATP-dependent Clp endopeptidase proteolytic subunit ClpP